MVTCQLTAHSLFKLYSRKIDTDAASIKILLKLTVGIPAAPPDDGEVFDCFAEVGDVVAGVDTAVEDDGLARVLDGTESRLPIRLYLCTGHDSNKQ